MEVLILFRDWEHYKQDFSNLQNEFWLGNEYIFTLTLQGLYPRDNELRIDMMNAKKIKRSVKLVDLNITNAASKYILHLNGFDGTFENALEQNRFSTLKSHNNGHQYNCPSIYSGDGGFLQKCNHH